MTLILSTPPTVRYPLRLLSALAGHGVPDLAAHEAHYGPLPVPRRPARLIDVISAAGLTGRGGGGYPAGLKLRAVAERPGRKVLVANGCEGEPVSRKDRLLLSRLPHLVLDGIELTAAAIGATDAYLCVHEGQDALVEGLNAAIAERGQDTIRVTEIPGRYVASEQSSLVQALNGGPAKPTFAPPRPHERGVGGRPTVVHNVETLAQIALIARRGASWFRRAGLPEAPGTTLVTAAGAVGRPGVYEVPLGTPLGEVVWLAGGPAGPVQALLTGGYFGAWLPAGHAWQVPLTHASLKAAGGALGAGIVIALPEGCCPLAETAQVLRYLAEESAGQCGPCMFGLPALATAAADLAFHGGRGSAAARVSSLADLVERRGACRHPDGAAQLARSMLRAFTADVRRHDQAGPCPGVAREQVLPVPGADWR